MITEVLLIAVSLVVVFLAFQLLLDKFSKDNEPSRKLLHFMHAVSLAIFAFVLPIVGIVAVEAVFLVSMFIARYLAVQNPKVPGVKYLVKVYRVGRVSYGEFFFPISVIAAAYLADTSWELATAVLILGIADAVAALVGKKYGSSNSYSILGQKKSLIGSLAFFVATFTLIVIFVALGHTTETGLFAILWVTLLLTVTENVGVYGSDNLLIPLVAVVLLNGL